MATFVGYGEIEKWRNVIYDKLPPCQALSPLGDGLIEVTAKLYELAMAECESKQEALALIDKAIAITSAELCCGEALTVQKVRRQIKSVK